MVKLSNKQINWSILLLILLFALLAFFISADLVSRFDAKFYHEVAETMSPALTWLMLKVTHLGDVWTVTVLAGIPFVFQYTRKRLALPLLAGVLSSTAVNLLLKELFGRERPDILRMINETTYSFPSGHAMVNTTFYLLLAYFAYKQIRLVKIRYALIGLCLLAIFSISISRVYLGVHYISDILGGMLFGAAIAMLIVRFFKLRLNEGSIQ